jgi:hypothetical protein
MEVRDKAPFPFKNPIFTPDELTVTGVRMLHSAKAERL